jgi:hypothetical protein
MSDHDKDFDFEPMPGIPSRLPKGETILWQGSPDARALAREAFKINWILGYMLVVVFWRAGGAWADGGLSLAMATGLPYLVLTAAGYAVIYLLAWAQARGSIYTITTSRVIMKVGAALPVTYTIPFLRIGTARLDVQPSGTGTIAMELTDGLHLSFAIMWPHLRPWHARQTQPAFRCIPNAAQVARILSDAAQTKLNEPMVTRAPVGAAVAAE